MVNGSYCYLKTVTIVNGELSKTIKMVNGELPKTIKMVNCDNDNDNDNIFFDHNIQIYTTDLQ